MFDRNHILQLRNDATLAAIDFGRARIEAGHDGGFVVQLDRPKVDITRLLDGEVPSRIEARSASEAEGKMLQALIAVQRAERRMVRCGIIGWTPEQICRRPLEAAELADYIAKIEHRTKVERLQRELAQAIARRARAEEEQNAADELAEKYGLSAAKQSVPEPLPNVRKRATARSTSK
ncbi:hypothetical protein GQL56_00340 [Pseudomonas putida]|nr:hypothetical protein [Pseudomonas putida]